MLERAGVDLGVLWASPGRLLDGSWALLGRSRSRRGRSLDGLGSSWARLGGQKAPEMEVKRVQNGVEEATRTENAISSKTMFFF